jgi:EmrB/QacA subfamily drug resistance transporter
VRPFGKRSAPFGKRSATALSQLRPRDATAWLLILAGLGVFFAADDQTSVVAVLPDMIDGVGLSQDEFYRAAWIVNGYILGYVVAMPLMGRIADSYGRGRIFALALLLFCFGSAWVAVSNSLTMISIARGVQAIGGGAVVPVSMALVTQHASPASRALGLGAIAAASEAGGLVGPLWGGGIAELLGWRWVFWINLPMCLPLAAGVWWLAKREKRVEPAKLDVPGAVLIGLSLVCLTIALTDDPVQRRALGTTLLLYAGAAAFFGLFLWRQARAPAPIVDLSLFRLRPLSAAFVTNGLVGGALIVAMVNVPLFTNIVMGGSALDGGLNLMRLTIALPFGALAGGYVATRYGYNAGCALGLACVGIGFVGMSAWDSDPGFVAMTAPLLVAGFGFGLVIAPINAAALGRTAEGDRATMASLLTVVRLLGALVGVALLTSRGLGGFYTEAGLIPLDDPAFEDLVRGLQVEAFQETFLVTGIICFISILVALLLGRDAGDSEDEVTVNSTPVIIETNG